MDATTVKQPNRSSAKPRGFAALQARARDGDLLAAMRLSQIAQMGARAARATAHRWTPQEARDAALLSAQVRRSRAALRA